MAVEFDPAWDPMINFYYESNYGTFSERLRFEGYELVFSDCIQDRYYNHVLHFSGDPAAVLHEAAEAFLSRKREPILYITPQSACFGEDLSSRGFQNWANDSWMLLEKEDFNLKGSAQGVQIERIGVSEKTIYLDTFQRAFGNPDDVYGALPDYYLLAEERFFSAPPELQSRIFLAKVAGRPVGVIRTVLKDAFCFVYALAVDKDFRQGGAVASALGAFAVQDAFACGAEKLLLQTEAGSGLERLYRAVGFKRIFSGRYYVPAAVLPA